MKPYIHKVQYYETDRMKVTHHSNYIRFMEEARAVFMVEAGLGYDKMEADGIVSPVISVSCEYKHPTTFADEISIAISVVRCSAVKLMLQYTMTSNDKLVATASSTHCFLDPNGKPIVLAEKYPEFHKVLKSLEEKK